MLFRRCRSLSVLGTIFSPCISGLLSANDLLVIDESHPAAILPRKNGAIIREHLLPFCSIVSDDFDSRLLNLVIEPT
jgi:hypothetical protein